VSGFIAPYIVNLGTRWRWAVSFTPRPLYPLRKAPIPIRWEAGWTPEPIRTRWWKEKNPSCPFHSLVTILTELPRLLEICVKPKSVWNGKKCQVPFCFYIMKLQVLMVAQYSCPHCTGHIWGATAVETKNRTSLPTVWYSLVFRVQISARRPTVLSEASRGFSQSLLSNDEIPPWIRQRSLFSRAVIALGYGLDDWVSRVRFQAGAGNFFLHHRVQNSSGAHPASYPMGNRGYFPGGKAAGAWS
jgi:hypothetical protein